MNHKNIIKLNSILLLSFGFYLGFRGLASEEAIQILNISSNLSENNYEIKTPNLNIRPIERFDEQRFLEINTNENVLKQADAPNFNENQMKPVFEKNLETWNGIKSNRLAIESVMNLGFAIIDIKTSQVIGFMSFKREYRRGYFETTTALDPNVWGKKIGTESRSAIIEYLFKKFNVPGLSSIVSTQNIPSRRLTEHMGFKIVGLVERKDSSGKKSNQIEYRLANPYLIPSIENQATHPVNLNLKGEILKIILNEEMPEISKFSSIYRFLQMDQDLVKKGVSREMLSRIAEELSVMNEVTLEDANIKKLEEILNNKVATFKESDVVKKYSLLQTIESNTLVFQNNHGQKLMVTEAMSIDKSKHAVYLIESNGSKVELKIKNIEIADSTRYVFENGMILEMPRSTMDKSNATLYYISQNKMETVTPAMSTEKLQLTPSVASKDLILLESLSEFIKPQNGDVYHSTLSDNGERRYVLQQKLAENGEIKSEIFLVDQNNKPSYLQIKERTVGFSNTLYHLITGEVIDMPSGTSMGEVPKISRPTQQSNYQTQYIPVNFEKVIVKPIPQSLKTNTNALNAQICINLFSH